MEYLLKTYTRLKKKERKGFTLVELLVVIAILAVLASVSVVGYLGFTTKAKNSNAVTELAQVREVIRGELLDGKNESFAYQNDTVYVFDNTSVTAVTTVSEEVLSYSNTDAATALKTALENGLKGSGDFKDLSGLKGEFTVTCDSDKNTTLITGKTLYAVSTIVYTVNGGTATWTMGTSGGIK